MKLDFILGDTIGESILGAVKEIAELSCDYNNEIIVLVPEDSSLMIEKLLLEERKALTNVHVYSFVRLLEKLDTSKKDKYISRENAILIVRKIIIENYDKLVCFKKSAKSLGFAELIYDTISQLKASRITPNEAKELAKTSKQSLQIKLHDIALIYEQYQNFLTNHYLDNCDKLDLLLEVIGKSELVANSYVFFVGFDNLTNQGAELCEILASVSRGVKVACPFIPKGLPNSHISDNELFEKVKRIADHHKLQYNPKVHRISRDKTFAHLKQNIFAYPYKTMPSDGKVVIFEGVEPSKEVEFVATEIYNDIHLGKVRPSDVAIVCPSLDVYSNMLETEFKDRELPLFINEPSTIASHPLFDLIKKSLECIRRGFETSDVIMLSKNAFFEFGQEGDAFENFVLKFGINHYSFLKPFEFGNGEEDYEVVEKVRNKLATFLQKLKLGIENAKTTQDFCNAVEVQLEEFNIKEKLTHLYDLQLELDVKSAKITEQVYDKYVEIFNGFKLFLGDVFCNLETFISLIDVAMTEGKINILPLTVSSIVVSTNISAISPKIKQVYVLGVLDGIIPFRKDDCGLIADDELGSLSDMAQKKIEPTIRTVNRRERFKTFNMLLLPSQKLTLTYSVFNTNGEESKPSSLIDGTRKLFTQNQLPLRVSTIYDIEPKIGNANKGLALYFGAKKSAEKKLLKLIKQERNNQNVMNMENVSSLYYALKDDLSETSKFVIENINENSVLSNIDRANELYFKHGTVSISELEKYFACPMQHFAVYGLGLKERALGGVKAIDVGNILHLVAEKFERQINVLNENNFDYVCERIIANSIEELEIPKEKNALILSILKGEAKRLCKTLLDESRNSSFKTVATEQMFGKGENTLKFNNNITLVGKVDRIDAWDNYFKIIDYKTGSIAVSPEDIYYGRKIQLVSYLLALNNYRNLKPAGVLYFPIRNDFADGEEKARDLYRNSGLVLNQTHVVLGIDNTLGFENPKSHIIKAEICNNKETRESGELKLKQNENLVSLETLEGLMKYVYMLSDQAISEILSGFVLPSPLSLGGGRLPCDYCPLAHCCGVNKTPFENGRKRLSKITNEQISQVKYE